ncbi:MAG: TlpA family protein disulfide reductase [Proteobacteria bacterium]|nr:TlpA family protein disulfide reductase [Pseudomonadota bacterium]
MRRTVLGLLFCLAAAVLCAGCDAAPAPKPGQTAPDLSLTDLAGRRHTLQNLRGRSVLLVFWKDGCTVCSARNLAALNTIYRRGKRGQLAVLTVNVGGSRGDVRDFVVNQGIIFPVLLDPVARASKRKYGVTLMPTTYLIDAQGVIRERLIGFFNVAAINKLVAPYVGRLGSVVE